MMLYGKFLYFVFIYLISNNKSVFVKSTNNLFTSNLSQEEDGNQNTGGSDGGLIASGVNGADGSSNVEGGSSPTAELKLFKAGADGNPVEIEPTEFYEDQYLGNLTYAFKPGVKCTLVKFEDKDVWKKGDQQVDEPKSVTYDSILGEVTVRDADNSVHFGKDGVTGEWKHVATIPRTKMAMAVKTAQIAPKVESPGSGLSLSTPEPETGSTGTPGSAEASGEVDEASEKEAEEGSTVVFSGADSSEETEKGSEDQQTGSKENPDDKEASSDEDDEAPEEEDDHTSGVTSEAGPTNEVSKDAGLRGTGASAEALEEAKEPGSLASGGPGTSEDKEAGSDPDGSSGGLASGEATPAGGDASSSGLTSSEDADSTAQTSPGDGDKSGEKGEKVEEVEGSQGGSSPPTPDAGSGTDTSSGEGTETAHGSADKGAGEGTGTGGEGEDGSSQPTEGSQSAGDSSPVKLYQDGTGTPPDSSGGDGSTVNPDRGGTGTLPTAGATELSNKTGVELSIKAKNGTDQFDRTENNKVVTFTAKDSFGFSSVKTKKGGCSGCCGSSCGGSDVAIWDAKDDKEYASKVVLEGKGDKNNKVVTVHLGNDSKKVFRKNSDNSWKMDDQKLKKHGSDSTKESLLKIYIKDPNDPSKTIEFDHSKIKPVGDKGGNKLYKYEFGDQDKCTEVKYSDESVWKHGDHGTNEHPKFIFYYELVKIVFVEVPKDTFQFYRKKLDKTWAHEQLKSTDKVDKDKVKLYTDSSGKNELASDKYSVKEFPFGIEFAFKEDSNCKQLKYETKKFTFEPDRSGKYPVNICFLNNKHCIFVYKSRAGYKTPDS